MAEDTAPKPEQKKSAAAEHKDAKPAAKQSTNQNLLILVGVVVVFGLLFASFAVGRASWWHNRAEPNARLSIQRSADVSPGDFGMMGGRYDSDADASDTRVAGVVTAVSGNTITVAGNGTTTKVEVSDNTTYYGDSEPAKVNDSIVAFGAKNSSDVLIASSVRLSRQ